MGVSLGIDWPDGEWEEVFLGSLKGPRQFWTPLAMKLGLELIPEFSFGIPVTPWNLEPMLAEVVVFRAELVRMRPEYDYAVMIVDRLLDALRRLKETEGWSASIA